MYIISRLINAWFISWVSIYIRNSNGGVCTMNKILEITKEVVKELFLMIPNMCALVVLALTIPILTNQFIELYNPSFFLSILYMIGIVYIVIKLIDLIMEK